MKYSKIFRTLVLVVILPLLLVVIPATPALAAPTITLSPTSGSIGTKVAVTGMNFNSYIGDYVHILFDGVEIEDSPIPVPSDGTFTSHFYVPDDATPGRIYVTVENDYGHQLGMEKPFTILETEIELHPNVGVVGTMVTISGQGFYASEMVTFYYYNGTRVTVGIKAATPTGECSYSFNILDSLAGDHKIEAKDARGNSAKANFEVIPSTTLQPTSGTIGDEVTISGTGFGYKSYVTIYFNDDKVTKGKTDEYGSFEITFNVPIMKPGTYNIKAKDDDGNTGKEEFTIAPRASLSQTTGNVGTMLIVSGTSFKVDGTVTIKYDDTEVATAITNDIGAFSVAFNAPASTSGRHTVTASDGVKTIPLVFTMESTPPPTPVLLLPEEASKTGAETYFDWKDVTDDSLPVTYTLQIATDKDFTAIVLEKKWLTYSDYTLTATEKLEPAEKEAAYYWRVRATDGASNESEWTDARAFYVGVRFAMPGWALYTLIGFGVLLVGFLCFWLGRRTAYSE